MTIHVAQWEDAVTLAYLAKPFITLMPNGHWLAVRPTEKIKVFEDRVQAAQWALEVQ